MIVLAQHSGHGASMSRARSLNGLSKVRPVLRSDSIMLGMCPGEFFSLEN